MHVVIKVALGTTLVVLRILEYYCLLKMVPVGLLPLRYRSWGMRLKPNSLYLDQELVYFPGVFRTAKDLRNEQGNAASTASQAGRFPAV
jgi:hypothetical protein